MTISRHFVFCVFPVLFLFQSLAAHAQHTLKIKVTDAATGESLPGANVRAEGTNKADAADPNGIVELKDLPGKEVTLKVTYVGYQDSTAVVSLPYPGEVFNIALHPAEEELEEVIVSSTRTNRRIEDLPLKVEVLGLEEMDEESTLVPGNIASILGDLAVITIQRTNPINGNDAIRMQGLDPQYTLIARDGLPLYGGFSGSLGVLAIPPLDLKQVEIIKGSVSTLYGGGAIAGMINIISRQPTEKTQGTILMNASTLKERNINTFWSGKLSKKVGYTLFAGANLKSAIDVNNDGFSEIPEHEDYIFHPRFFFDFSTNSKLNVGWSTTIDNRKTGDMKAITEQPTPAHSYLRTEKTLRNVLDVEYTHFTSPRNLISFKTALSAFTRDLSYPYREYPDFRYKGLQYSSYSEVSDRALLGKHTLVVGANLITESLRRQSDVIVPLTDYDFVTVGAFIQDDWEVSPKFTIETGMRLDHQNIKGFFPLPRIALFYKPSDKLSVRLASGAGYRAPSILAQSDPTPYTVNNAASVASEHSVGVNADINYNTHLGEVEVSLNQAFYYAQVTNPLRVVTDTLAQRAYLENQNYSGKTLGTDTYAQMTWKQWELYLGYNHTEAIQQYTGLNNPMPFNPKDKFSTTLAFAVEGKWRTGVEGSWIANQCAYAYIYYFGSQTIYPSFSVPNYWFWAAMVERKVPFGSIVLNVENIFDARQAKYGKLIEGPVTSPTFRAIWGPLDGRVINLSIKVNI
ncbi:MAG: TonB-dependent receptor [Bacteroidetes bacterium]|nr:TonB-dependent receptor [Bacteroidota bacterium]